jgi:site-specific recombinase XerD
MQLKDAIHDFLTHCEVGKYQSKKTVENYAHYLKRFALFAKPHRDTESIDQRLIQNYRLHLTDIHPEPGSSLDIRTQQYHLIALRALLKYLAKNDVPTLAPEKIELPKVPERHVEALTREELTDLFAAIDPTKRNGVRDLAILHMLYSTGLRVSELSNLNKEQINLQRREFQVRGKGRKIRIVFLSDEAATHLQRYLDARNDNFKPMFVSNSNRSGSDIVADDERRRLQPQAIERIVREAALRANIIKKVTPHVLRHTFATELLRNGADIRSVQEMLGHASITTTQIYTHLTNQRLKEVHEQFHR